MLFNNIVLISDLDGTLLDDAKKISDKNMSAIGEFIDNGGIFTIATGRGVASTRDVAEELQLAAPAVVFNGAAVYLFSEKHFLWQCSLSDSAPDYVSMITARFPTIGVEILRGEDVYVTQSNRREERRFASIVKTPIWRPLGDIPPDGWLKVLYVDEPETIDELIVFGAEHCGDDVHLVRSESIYCEMLPGGVNKGAGLDKLLEIIEADGRYIVATGDYDNDVEMLEYADLGIAVANATPSAMAAADMVVGDNNSDVIWEIVEYLKKSQ